MPNICGLGKEAKMAPQKACRTIATRVVMLPALLLMVASCNLPGLFGPQESIGALDLTIGDASARTLIPGFDMTPASFVISGSGPRGKSFSRTSTSTSVQINGLATGQWSVSVTVKNASAAAIGQGTGSVSISNNQRARLTVAVAPFAGNGALHLSVSWTPANLIAPSVSAQLLPASGSPIPLAFVMGPGSASSDTGGIPAGYYTLTLQLLDNDAPVTGAVEVVRIVEGQTTSGSFDFTQAAGDGGGAISVAIAAEASDPLSVTVTGQALELSAGAGMTVTAAASGYSGNATYIWYLNGQPESTGASLTLGSALPAGIYRLDVTAFSAYGIRAGAATLAFTVS